MSVNGQGSVGGMSRKTYSKNGTSLEKMKGPWCPSNHGEREESRGGSNKKARS